jgi:hypothetical protein
MMCRCSAEKRGSAAAQIPQNLRKGGSSYPRKGGSSYLRKGGSSWATQHLREGGSSCATQRQRNGGGGCGLPLVLETNAQKTGSIYGHF